MAHAISREVKGRWLTGSKGLLNACFKVLTATEIGILCLVCQTEARAEMSVPDLATGGAQTCATQPDGSLWCWGSNGYGQLGIGTTAAQTSPMQVLAPSGGNAVAEVSAGQNHTCLRMNNGSLFCWGRNDSGQLGDGNTTQRVSRAYVSTLGYTVVEVSAGYDHTCARTTGGKLFCWGSNARGQLGIGTDPSPRTTPTLVTLPGNAVAAEVTTGTYFTCARSTDGSLYCWGDNTFGQLGLGDLTQRTSPVQVPLAIQKSPPIFPPVAVKFAGVSAGERHTCAMSTDHKLWCWGYGSYGQLGNGTSGYSTSPQQVTVLGANVAQLSAGHYHTCARESDNTLWCWGDNRAGELGIGNAPNQLNPIQVSALGATVAEVSAGNGYTCAHKTDGTLWCSGSNGSGQLGDGTTTDRSTPVKVAALTAAIAEVSVGYEYSCARKTDGTIWCWGDNSAGQLGDGTTLHHATPVKVQAPGVIFAEVAAHSHHTCARTMDGRLFCWGDNSLDQLGIGNATPQLTPVQVSALGNSVAAVAVGEESTCASKGDGTLWCWGANEFGQLGLGSWGGLLPNPTQVKGLNPYLAILDVSIGLGTTCAVEGDGTLWCWGLDDFGQIGVGNIGDGRATPTQVTAISNITKVSGNIRNTCAIDLSLKLYCWGDNSTGQLGGGNLWAEQATPLQVPAQANGYIDVSTGYSHTCARTADNGLWCWGDNSCGQLGIGPASTTPQMTPLPVTALGSAVAKVAAGESHTCARKLDGTMWCWGCAGYGALGDGTFASATRPPQQVVFPGT